VFLGGSACSSITATEGSSSRALLFIGNSLTYANDLPAIVAMVAEAGHSWSCSRVIAAMRLAPRIRAADARTALFLPWSRRQFPQSPETAGQSAGLAARAVGGVGAPIGIAWREALSADPTVQLYGPDGYHPAPAGTLLAALTPYDRLFGRDVRAIPAESLADLPAVRLTAAQVRVLAAAAHAASESWPADSPIPVPKVELNA
jgi:hypothetical protein